MSDFPELRAKLKELEATNQELRAENMQQAGRIQTAGDLAALVESGGQSKGQGWMGWDAILQAPLTPREQDILQQVAEGLSNREIADLLNLSHKTVEVHRAKVMQKMSARTLSQLIRMAMALDILKLYGGNG